MNEQLTEFERELSAVQPAPMTAALQERIGEALSPPVVAPRRQISPLWLVPLVGPIAAALVYFLLRGPIEAPSPSQPVELLTESVATTAFNDELPSVWSFRQTMDRPQAEIDALLDKHANKHATNPQRAGIYVLSRSDSELEKLWGEL
jgi:hypothetical protein